MEIRRIKDEAKKIKDKAERKKLEASDDYKNRINAANRLFKESEGRLDS
jgi:Txe/YoeB family toxin of Txe-Axe toxin-antitoxin module